MNDLPPIPYSTPKVAAAKAEVTEAGDLLIEFTNGRIHKMTIPTDVNLLVRELEYFAQRIRHDWHLFD